MINWTKSCILLLIGLCAYVCSCVCVCSICASCIWSVVFVADRLSQSDRSLNGVLCSLSWARWARPLWRSLTRRRPRSRRRTRSSRGSRATCRRQPCRRRTSHCSSGPHSLHSTTSSCSRSFPRSCPYDPTRPDHSLFTSVWIYVRLLRPCFSSILYSSGFFFNQVRDRDELMEIFKSSLNVCT